tara:strand:- start:1640 stop:3124 length:1485 start_codon:yes stop_codon:yes gene_type:complete
MKISFIGAGSIGFTQTLVRDLLKVPEFHDTNFFFHDISEKNLEFVSKLIQKDIDANNLPATIEQSTNRKKALEGAKYIINCTRIGGLEAFEHDINIPLQYGVDQCVGDTICAGGILYGQRNIPQTLNFCKDIKSYSDSNALFLNYSNPMAMNTWAAISEAKVNTVGLCHGVQGGAKLISKALGSENSKDLEYMCSGINHMTWYIDLKFKGKKVSKEELIDALERHPEISKQEKVRIDILKRFGLFSTESNGHLSEYLPWYRKRVEDIPKWIDLSNWIHGETGGYLRVTSEKRNWFEEDFEKFLSESGIDLNTHKRSSEHGSYIIESIETNRPYRGHFNVVNNGTITNLPDDCVIESTGTVDKDGIKMIKGIELPMACASLCRTSIDVQRMAVKAAIDGDINLLKLAVLQDPLVSAVCSPDEVWSMVDEMIVAQSKWLPQYQNEIELALERIKNSNVKKKNFKGAARMKTRSPEELKNDEASSLLVEAQAFEFDA